MLIVMGIAGILLLFIGYMLVRNAWVYNKQMDLITTGIQDNYLDYDQMFYRFWVWNIEKLKKDA